MRSNQNNAQPLNAQRKLLFGLVLAGLVVLGLASIVAGAEAVLRLQRSMLLNDQIDKIKADIARGNATHSPAQFKGYIGREEQSREFFKHVSNIPAVYRPYIEWRRLPGYTSDAISINSLGYRGPEFSVAKPADTFRVLVYGGSTAWGSGALKDDETIPGRLGHMLNERVKGLGKKIEVINCGETGYHSTQELVFLVTEGIFLDPDLVVFYDGVNDTSRGYTDLPPGYPNQYNRFAELLTKPVQAKYREGFTVDNELEYLKKQRSMVWKTTSLELVKRFRVLLEKSASSQEDDAPAAPKEKTAGTSPEYYAVRNAMNMQAAKGIGQTFGFEVVAFIQPVPMHFKPLHPDEKSALEYLAKSYAVYDSIISYHVDHYVEYGDDLNELYDDLGVRHCDLRKVFEGNNEPIYYDNCHMTSHGYDIVADAMASYLVDHGLIRAQ